MKVEENRISYVLSNNSVLTENIKPADAKSIKLDKKSIIIKKGLQVQIKAILPEGCADYVYWESDSPDIINCSSSGIIKALGKGKTTVRAYTDSGVMAECKVEVKL